MQRNDSIKATRRKKKKKGERGELLYNISGEKNLSVTQNSESIKEIITNEKGQ